MILRRWGWARVRRHSAAWASASRSIRPRRPRPFAVGRRICVCGGVGGKASLHAAAGRPSGSCHCNISTYNDMSIKVLPAALLGAAFLGREWAGRAAEPHQFLISRSSRVHERRPAPAGTLPPDRPPARRCSLGHAACHAHGGDRRRRPSALPTPWSNELRPCYPARGEDHPACNRLALATRVWSIGYGGPWFRRRPEHGSS